MKHIICAFLGLQKLAKTFLTFKNLQKKHFKVEISDIYYNIF